MFLNYIKQLFARKNHDNSIILVVDDNLLDLNNTCAMVVRGGYNTLKAANGTQGFNLAKKHHPDLIILDIHLPDMLGFDVCRALKDHADTQHIPIIFLTVLDSPKIILESYELGAENYLLKPLTEPVLLKQIHLTLQDYQEQINTVKV